MCGICNSDSTNLTLCGKHRLRWERLGKPPVQQFVIDSIADPMHGLSWLTCKECGTQYRAQKYRATCNDECALARRQRQSREAKRREDPELANDRRRRYRAEGRAWVKELDRRKAIAARKYETCITCGKTLLDEYRKIKFCSDECAKIDLARRATRKRREADIPPRAQPFNDALDLAAIALTNRPENIGRYVSSCEDCGIEIRSKTGRRVVCSKCRRKRQSDRQTTAFMQALDVESFVIIDDADMGFTGLKDHWVKTKGHTGITRRDSKKALTILEQTTTKAQ